MLANIHREENLKPLLSHDSSHATSINDCVMCSPWPPGYSVCKESLVDFAAGDIPHMLAVCTSYPWFKKFNFFTECISRQHIPI